MATRKLHTKILIKFFIMKYILLAIAIFVFPLANMAQSVDAETFKKSIEKTKNPLIIDVRTPQEFNIGHIENAKLIDFYATNFREQLIKLPKNQTIFLYCKSGNRSGQAYQLLHNAGFKNVKELRGGIGAWQQAGYSLTN